MAVAYSTAEEYNLASVVKALERQGLYEQKVLSEDLSDVLCAAAKYEVDEESRDLFIFRLALKTFSCVNGHSFLFK